MNEKRMTKTNTAMDYIGYALYAFGGLGVEILLMLVETNLYGYSAGAWSVKENIIHWSMTCMIWGGLGIVLMEQLPDISKKDVQSGKLVTACVMIVLSIMYTSFVWNGFKPVIELSNLGIGKFFMQYFYYVFESLLILLIIVFGQEALEQWFCNVKYIPFGGIFLAITWGLVHILTQGISTGVYAIVQALFYGSIYLLLDKNYKISYVAIVLMFTL